MMKNISTIVVLGFVALTNVGCTSQPAGEPPHYFGNAVRQNMAAQLVNPEAPTNMNAPDMEGNRAVLAQQKYITNKVDEAKVVVSGTAQNN